MKKKKHLTKIPPVVYCNICGKVKSGTHVLGNNCTCQSISRYIHTQEQWEYYREYVTRKIMMERMNELGKQGWRCIGTVSYLWVNQHNEHYAHHKDNQGKPPWPNVSESDEFMIIFERRVV